MEIVLATRNAKKIEELRRLLKGIGFTLLSLESFPDCPEVEETGSRFEENAIEKAQTVARFTKKPAIADDSGLEVDALSGAPGVLSARYAGEGATDKDNLNKLLKNMHSIAEGKRQARFVCVIALAYPDGKVKTFEGSVEGSIAKVAMGRHGFGYDPVFYPKGFRRTFAEMSHSEKDSLSHRQKALRKLHEYLIHEKQKT
ncbi:MAG: XTP/dITP diphosphatase [Nitrospirae bacterium]|nr:XTP/dITP diphosphatase [Nitrospirota bacterium]